MPFKVYLDSRFRQDTGGSQSDSEFTIELPIKGEVFVDRMSEKGVLAGIPVSRLINNNKELDNFIVVASTETNTEDDMNSYIEAANEAL